MPKFLDYNNSMTEFNVFLEKVELKLISSWQGCKSTQHYHIYSNILPIDDENLKV
jgi:hypothetical protein